MKKTVIWLTVLWAVTGRVQPYAAEPAAEVTALQTAQTEEAVSDYQLEKVVIFSRHGLRSPIEKNPQEMAAYSPYPWAKWDVPSGHLTAKGTLLETYFGQYLGQWLRAKGVLTAQNCASGEGIFAYANSVQRTVATAQAIIAGGFAGCHVPLHYQGGIGEKDPIFHAVAHSPSREMVAHAKKQLDLIALHQSLKPHYQLLGELIGYARSPNCVNHGHCDLAEHDSGKPADYAVAAGKSVRITGNIATAKKIVSNLLLAYYVGKPNAEIAGGNIDNRQQWQAINDIKNAYYRHLFQGNTELAQNVAYPLLAQIQQALNSYQISLLVGHDSNIVALLAALQTAPYTLPDSLENIPIGGKLLFQVWRHRQSNERKFKLEYVYQTTDQIRHLTPLSLTAPPQRVPLTLNGCHPDRHGFCHYTDFVDILNRAVQQGKQSAGVSKN